VGMNSVLVLTFCTRGPNTSFYFIFFNLQEAISYHGPLPCKLKKIKSNKSLVHCCALIVFSPLPIPHLSISISLFFLPPSQVPFAVLILLRFESSGNILAHTTCPIAHVDRTLLFILFFQFTRGN
jgi:hypothetical protein